MKGEIEMKKEIMKRAWEIARQGQEKFGGKAIEYIAEALRMAWKEAKQPKEIVLKIRHEPSGGKEWVAEIVVRDPKWNYERKFLNPVARNWSSSGKTGTTSFLLEEGKVYEVNEPWKGRYFITVQNGEVVDVDVDYVAEKIA